MQHRTAANPKGADCGPHKPRLLDLFCGAGGAAKGYQRAGFYVVGVDHVPQPRYCGDEFHQADAMTYPLEGFDVIHASPPCQPYSVTASLHNSAHPDLYEATRERLKQSRRPWVIENVRGAPYQSGIVLCGSSFGLHVWRHRNFEASEMMLAPTCQHHKVPQPIDVTGVGGPGGRHRKPESLAQGRAAMGIDWMTRRELSQAVPPAYSEYIGRLIMEAHDAAP